MKKIVSLLLIVSIMLSFAIITSAKADVTYLYGDVDKSGDIDDIDAMLLSRHLAGWPDIEIDLELADGNGDGEVDDIDDMLMTRYLAQWDQGSVDGFRYGTEAVTEEPEYLAKVSIKSPSQLQLGSTMPIDCDIEVVPAIDTDEPPIVTYYYQSSNNAISAYDETFEAVKMGESVVTVRVVAYYPELGITANGYATHTINVVDNLSTKVNITSAGSTEYEIVNVNSNLSSYATYLQERLLSDTGANFAVVNSATEDTKGVILSTSPVTVGETIVTAADCRSGGYVIQMVDGNIVVVAKDINGMDKAVRYLAKYYIDANGDFATPDNMNIVDSNGAYPVESITINGVDISNYVIVIPEGYNNEATYDNGRNAVEGALVMLRRYIQFACGERLNAVNAPSDAEYQIELLVDDTGELPDEGFRTTVTDGKLTITGSADYQNTKRGVLYGVMDLVENYLGVKFINPDSSSSQYYIYESKHIELADGFDYKDEPGIEYRHVTGLGGSEEYYRMPLKQNGGNLRSMYGKGMYTTFYHAHSFEEQFKGTLGSDNQIIGPNNQPCLTKRGQSDICWNSIVGLIEQRMGDGYGNLVPGQPDLMWISVAWSDNENYCNCSQCRKVVTEEGSISGPLVRLANDMADRLANHEVYNPIKIFTIGYGTTARKPTKTALRDNVILCYCWNGCNNHPFTGEECNERGCRGLHFNNIKDREYYEGWVANSTSTHVWYYSSPFSWRLAPMPIVDNIYYDFKYLAEVGCDGVYAESGAGNNPLSQMNCYLMARALWDPYMEYEEYMDVVREYVRVNFGDGWEYIMEFIEMWDESSEGQDCWLTNYSHPYEMMSMDYYAENYDYINELLDKAEAMASTSRQQYNIQYMRITPEFFALSGMYDDMYVNGDAEAQALYAERYTNLYNFIKDNNIDIGGNGGNARMTDEPCNPMKVWYDFSSFATWY